MDPFVELLKQINIAQVFVILAAFWMFYKRLDNKIERLENKIERLDSKLEEKCKELKNEINKLADKVEDIDRRLCRIEGSLATHGHCLFNQAKPEQKAE